MLPRMFGTLRALLLRANDYQGVDEIDAELSPASDPRTEADLRIAVGELCDALTWRAPLTVDAKVKSRHINVHELAALRTVVRRALRCGMRRRRLLVAIDSMVVEACVAKGRSSSRQLLYLLRSVVSELLFAELRIGTLPVQSAKNPSDPPSRRRRLRRGPVADAAPWTRRFLAGDLNAWPRIYDPRPELLLEVREADC